MSQPLGVGHCHHIPKDYFVIAVSKAILIEGLNPSLWIMTHLNHMAMPMDQMMKMQR